jgi:hypothetical protein
LCFSRTGGVAAARRRRSLQLVLEEGKMKVSGVVYRSGGKERMIKATVKATGKGGPHFAVTNNAGDFVFDNLDPGEWSFVALQEDSFPSGKQTVELMEDKTDLEIYLRRLAGEHDQKAGTRFFYIILAIFAALVVVYLATHIWLPRTEPGISLVVADRIAAVMPKITASDKPSADAAITTGIASINSSLLTVLTATVTLNDADKSVIQEAANRMTAAVKDDDKAAALEQLAFLKQQMEGRQASGFALWNTDPLRYLEILLWGLAGVLVTKIITSGVWLWKHSFYGEAIPLHVAHLVTTPVLVLVAVLLLSLASIQITVAGSSLTLDISNPNTLIVAAFLLGTVSYPLWNFVENTAKKVLGQTP